MPADGHSSSSVPSDDSPHLDRRPETQSRERSRPLTGRTRLIAGASVVVHSEQRHHSLTRSTVARHLDSLDNLSYRLADSQHTQRPTRAA